MTAGALLALRRIGPYHQSRLEAAIAAGLSLTVLQTRPKSQEYPWNCDPAGLYALNSLQGSADPEVDPPLELLDRQLHDLLARCKPAVIVSVGWADRAYQRLLLLAQRRRIPVVIVSDSRECDETRTAGKEWLKRQLLRGYSAALVAGCDSRSYMQRLRFPAAAIFQPWDVVDNAFFAAAQAAGRQQAHFLSVSRLIAKKNHQGLLMAYASYQQQGGRWGLQLVGSGPLELSIRSQVAALPHPERVALLPFCQIETLCALYGQAGAFVLASTNDQWGLVVNEAMAAGLPCLVSSACGCAVDLIEHGITGWCFDPGNPAALTALMHQAERQSLTARQAMVAAARERLQTFSLDRFASGLQQAVEHALASPRFSRRAALTAELLSRRP